MRLADGIAEALFSSAGIKATLANCTAVKDLYADIEAIFVCAQQQEALAAGTDSAHEMRKKLSKLLSSDAPIGEVLDTMRGMVLSTLKTLEA